MADVFISYRRDDSSALATVIATQLERQRITTFVEPHEDSGGPFPERLRREIEAAPVFVCLLGATTFESTWVLEEIEHARNLGKIMIPVFQERYVAPDPIPNENVRALLQSEGVHIPDGENADEAIESLGQMIGEALRSRARTMPTAPPRFRVGMGAGLLLIVLVLGGLGLFVLPQLNGTRDGAQAPSETATPPVTNTDAPLPTNTSAPISTNAPTLSVAGATSNPDNTPLPASAPLGFPGNPTTANVEWMPYVDSYAREFDGIEMVLVPTGCFQMGGDPEASDDSGAAGIADGGTQCFEQPFWIGRYEITNAQYGSSGSFSEDQRPRETVSWLEARDFCASQGLRLPTEAEWEYAARGPDGLLFPWGNEWDSANVITNRGPSRGTAEVGSLADGVSWIGAYDMIGNLLEWTLSEHRDYPYVADDGREVDDDRADVFRVLRGGSWAYTNAARLRAASRLAGDAGHGFFNIGFRCARDYE